jgi:hypothetical protein
VDAGAAEADVEQRRLLGGRQVVDARQDDYGALEAFEAPHRFQEDLGRFGGLVPRGLEGADRFAAFERRGPHRADEHGDIGRGHAALANQAVQDAAHCPANLGGALHHDVLDLLPFGPARHQRGPAVEPRRRLVDAPRVPFVTTGGDCQ